MVASLPEEIDADDSSASGEGELGEDSGACGALGLRNATDCYNCH